MVRRSSPRGGCVMSPSMRSKTVSESSLMTGTSDATDPAESTAADGATDLAAVAPGGDPETPRARSGKPVRPTLIELEVSRQRAIGWTIFGLVLGGLLIHGLGTVGVWV